MYNLCTGFCFIQILCYLFRQEVRMKFSIWVTVLAVTSLTAIYFFMDRDRNKYDADRIFNRVYDRLSNSEKKTLPELSNVACSGLSELKEPITCDVDGRKVVVTYFVGEKEKSKAFAVRRFWVGEKEIIQQSNIEFQ